MAKREATRARAIAIGVFRKNMRRQTLLADIGFGLALVGIVLSIIELEYFYYNLEQHDMTTELLKLFVTITTILLEVSLFVYHRCSPSWRPHTGFFGLTSVQWAEMAICLLHVPPWSNFSVTSQGR
eukprot:GILK01026168.1.p2 GENE.GILK01026168.1~~GILK01026168.1.p2  ORF type:complete len:146 (+),score=15.36 GILK01026168.1:63-440(+)